LGAVTTATAAPLVRSPNSNSSSLSFPRQLDSSFISFRITPTRESDIDNALRNQFMTFMRVGYFDDDIPLYASLNETDICTAEHQSLALDGARQGIVLLKNHGNLLPLDANKIHAVAMHGPHVMAPERVIWMQATQASSSLIE
jgi:beta-glucosidase-like glycosyl hydrolase